MRNVLVIQHSRVLLELHQVNGQSGDLPNHDSAQGVGHADIRLTQDELDLVRRHVEDLHLGEPLVRHLALGTCCGSAVGAGVGVEVVGIDGLAVVCQSRNNREWWQLQRKDPIVVAVVVVDKCWWNSQWHIQYL